MKAVIIHAAGDLLTAVLPIEEADAAFQLAGDRRRAMKVQIAF